MARQANVSVPQLQQMGNLTAMVSGNFQGGVEAAANLNEQLYKMRTGQGDTSFHRRTLDERHEGHRRCAEHAGGEGI